MDDVLFKISSFDRSVVTFGKLAFLKTKVMENLDRYTDVRSTQIGRIDSKHLLVSLLTNLAVVFDGDLFSYMNKVATASRRMVGAMGLVTVENKGNLFTEGVFYPGCKEIITCIRSPYDVMDLWRGWRTIPAVTVQQHPLTDFTMFEPGVMNKAKFTESGLCVLNIDLPLLAAQWQMFRASSRLVTMEAFITQIVMPAFMRSHVDLVLMNKVAAKLGVIPECLIQTNNVNFMQNSVNTPADQMVDDVVKLLMSKLMAPRNILSTIPAIIDATYLDAVSKIRIMPAMQVMWAKEASRYTAAGVVLELCSLLGDGKSLDFITKVKRNKTEADDEGWYRNGLTTSEYQYVYGEYLSKVISRLK